MRYFNFHAHLGKTTLGDANTVDDLVSDMKALGIEKAGICNLTLATMKAKNDLIHDAKQKYPDFIRAYAYLNFKDPTVIDEIDLRMKQGFDGFKIINQWEGIRSDHYPPMENAFLYLRKFNKVIQIGTGSTSTPYPFIEYARQYPEMQICFTHIGQRELGNSIIAAVKDVPNITVETSQNYDRFILRKAVDVLSSKRVLMGTDWPYKPQYTETHKMEDLGFSDEQLEDINYRNAARIWGDAI